MAQCSKDTYLKIGCFFSVETENPIELQNTGIEVDLSIKNFLTISDDMYVPNPGFFVNEEETLVKVKRKQSKFEKGTSERAKALKALQHVRERIANKKEDFVQKVSLDFVRFYDLISFEGLNIKGLKITALQRILQMHNGAN